MRDISKYVIIHNMQRTLIKDLSIHKIGNTGGLDNEVMIQGWVDVRRDQGKMVFLDIRDVTGKVQAVVLPGQTEALEIAQKLRSEWRRNI